MTEIKEIIKDQLSQLMELVGVDLNEIEIEKQDEYWRVRIDTEENALLIGRHGKTVQSLQLLLRFLVYKQTGIEEWQKILLDVDDYREKRKQEVTDLALETAQKVEFSNRPIMLSGLSPFERRIVHMTLADNPNVETESTGEGKNRRLTVSPK
jgi:spoIIIJ-associated protein